MLCSWCSTWLDSFLNVNHAQSAHWRSWLPSSYCATADLGGASSGVLIATQYDVATCKAFSNFIWIYLSRCWLTTIYQLNKSFDWVLLFTSYCPLFTKLIIYSVFISSTTWRVNRKELIQLKHCRKNKEKRVRNQQYDTNFFVQTEFVKSNREVEDEHSSEQHHYTVNYSSRINDNKVAFVRVFRERKSLDQPWYSHADHQINRVWSNTTTNTHAAIAC